MALPTETKKISKIWVAIGTPFQANFFAPLIKELERECDFVVTARDHDGIHSILRAKGIDFIPVGKHGGKELSSKLEAYAATIQEMLPIVQRTKPDLVLTERWPEAVRVAFGLNIPSWTIFYDERETYVNQMVFPLATKVFTPRFYGLPELFANGVTDPEKVMWFNGFHTCYLKDEKESTSNPFEKIGIKSPIVFVRPEPEFATFFPSHKPVLEKAVEIIAKNGNATVAVLPRTEAQRKHYSGVDNVQVLDKSMSDCPVAHVDVALGAAETMLMEAFVLGKPSVSAIYWPVSKPVVELHRYIPHSTEPAEIADHVERLLGEEEREKFRSRSSLLVKSMDNPTQMMIDEIRRINLGNKVDNLFSRRSRIEIFLDIIQSTSLRPLRLTHIMRDANISHNELKKILATLESGGLILSQDTLSGKLYQATSDGLKVLEDYRGIRQRLFVE
jgi:predicted glycosyltransferase/predicted transcriptional regulator